jgi:hypothetical protein
MYLLTIRDGLQTRHIGPFASTVQAAAHLDQLLVACGDRAHWQIHELEAPVAQAAAPPVRAEHLPSLAA